MVLMGLEIGGAETHVVELSAELKKRGNEVYVASNGGVYESELEKYGILHYTLPLNKKDPSSLLKSYTGLYRIIKKNKFDIVHSHARIPSFICGLLQKRLKFRFITSAHWVFKLTPVLKFMTNWGERSVAVSNDIKKYLTDGYGYDEKRIDVTINGIDTDKFSKDTDFSSIEKEFSLTKTNHRIVYVSRIDTDRSAVAFNLINISDRLLEKYPDLQIVIVGGGNDFERLCGSIEEKNKKLGERVLIATNSRVDINKFVASGDIFVGVSRSSLVAMSAEKPVIIAGNEGYIGVFDKSKEDISIKTNFCCRGCVMPDDSKLFFDICSIFDGGNYDEMSKFNRNFILKNYSVGKMTDDYENAYKKLLYKNPFRKHDILISGYYGFKNTGDDSLLRSIIDNIRDKRCDADITVLSKTPRETSLVYGVKCINRFNIIKIFYRLKSTRLLISGGGSLLQDVTSTKSYKYYSTIIKLAQKQGAKVMVYANGIGPLRNEKNRTDCKAMLDRVDVITLRDENSLSELKRIGVKKDAVVTADPAFSLKPSGPKIAEKAPYFIVSVRKWKKLPADFIENMGFICRTIKQEHNVTPVFIPMQGYIDKDICLEIAKLCGGKIRDSFSDISDMLGYIKNAEFVIGMRLHILIYALNMNVPIIALSYDPKIDSIVDKWDFCKAFDVSKIDCGEILAQSEYILQNRTDISGKINEISEEMRKNTARDTEIALNLMNY